jgi:protein-L-isoaspartate(D-aspartate) O-methyltransferase
MTAANGRVEAVGAALLIAGLAACGVPATDGARAAPNADRGAETASPRASASATSTQAAAAIAAARDALLAELRSQGIESGAVLDAIGRVPRERFVPAQYRALAYGNHPLPIGHGQTISQPYIVALMTELLELQAGDRVLEIGTGSGYQAAVLAELDAEIYSLEIVEELAADAATLLRDLGYERVHVLHGDGYLGWPQEAPFDRVIVTAAPEEIPQPLIEQLRVGGKMVVPVGPAGQVQQLTLLEKRADGSVETTRVLSVAFVPMVR